MNELAKRATKSKIALLGILPQTPRPASLQTFVWRSIFLRFLRMTVPCRRRTTECGGVQKPERTDAGCLGFPPGRRHTKARAKRASGRGGLGDTPQERQMQHASRVLFGVLKECVVLREYDW
jgi:hypothetical protein